MDMVREILLVLKGQDEAVTIRHIAFRTGFSPSTLVGIMMSMIAQGFISEVHPKDLAGKSSVSRCTCAYCRRTEHPESSTSLDRRTYQICMKGEIYLINWSTVPKKRKNSSFDQYK